MEESMKNIISIMLMLGISIAGPLAAQAKGHKTFKKHPDAYRYVYAESQFNPTKSITAPVRHARLGDQVLVPELGWTYCEYSCKYTLQKKHLDFWEGIEDDLSSGMLHDLVKRHFRRD